MMRKVQLILFKESLPIKPQLWSKRIFREELDVVLKLYYLPAIQKFLNAPTLFTSLFGKQEEYWRSPMSRWERLKYWFKNLF